MQEVPGVDAGLVQVIKVDADCIGPHWLNFHDTHVPAS